MEITPQILMLAAAIGAVMLLFIIIPIIVIPLQKKRRKREAKTSLPQGSDSTDFSRFLRDKYQEETYLKQTEGDEFQ